MIKSKLTKNCRKCHKPCSGILCRDCFELKSGDNVSRLRRRAKARKDNYNFIKSEKQ